MSKGTRVVPIRIPEHLLAAIDDQVAASVTEARGEPYTRTGWILRACRQELAHLERAREQRARRKARNQARKRAAAGGTTPDQ